VWFGGSPSTVVLVVTDQIILCLPPPQRVMQADILVMNLNGHRAILRGAYRYVEPAAIVPTPKLLPTHTPTP